MYLDLSQLALKYLKDTEVNINNILIITENFNIRNSFWDPNHSYHSSHKDTFFDIANSFQLEISKLVEFFPTRYSNNAQDLNSILDLIFLHPFSPEFNNYIIHSNWRLTSDHASITVNILIIDKYIQTKQWSLIKNSEEENHFIKELIDTIKNMDMFSIQSNKALENIVQKLATNIDNTWHKYFKNINITKHSKAWWDKDCHKDLNMYHQSRCLEDWKKFKRTVKNTKHTFFHNKINEITNKKCSPWKLMNWVKKCKLPAIKAIKYNG